MTLDEQVLDSIQEDLVARLETVAYLNDVEIVALRAAKSKNGKQIADIRNLIKLALSGLSKKNGKNGACVQVLMPLFDVVDPNIPGPQGDLVIEALVQENPLVNNGATGTGKTSESIAIAVHQALHLFRLEGITESLYSATDAMTPSLEDAPNLTYRVKFKAKLCLPAKPKCLLPQIAESAPGQITFTNRTAAADIYFTTDRSFPYAGNATATKFTDPFLAAPGTFIRWAAYKEGLLGSDVGMARVD